MRALILAAALGCVAAQAAACNRPPKASESERQTPTPCTAQQDSQDAQARRSPPTPPAAASTAAPQPVFIISCNPSGCNDNQGRFLTRSGPQRLVGPNGLSCQSMGGNWQCSPGNPP
ncbi:hypothetical protein M2375_003204 [Comamonas sp. BIGb0152]|uniref:hypothetical protein n=1 Tax=Comamonas sp. BIGb0152 TaxID=2940601 RepID=UPI00216797ED|nr:hypothetical protein [Comamonas sp. BIGb0152]MCS4294971.1 hypothetical protein [Comamonas sp. BIGb0152]